MSQGVPVKDVKQCQPRLKTFAATFIKNSKHGWWDEMDQSIDVSLKHQDLIVYALIWIMLSSAIIILETTMALMETMKKSMNCTDI